MEEKKNFHMNYYSKYYEGRCHSENLIPWNNSLKNHSWEYMFLHFSLVSLNIYISLRIWSTITSTFTFFKYFGYEYIYLRSSYTKTRQIKIPEMHKIYYSLTISTNEVDLETAIWR